MSRAALTAALLVVAMLAPVAAGARTARMARTARATSGAALTLALGTRRRGELVVRVRALGPGGAAMRPVTREAPA